MENRNDLLRNLRGPALGNLSVSMSGEELFQNEVLRPILKFQNNLLIQVFKHHLTKHKIDFNSLTVDKKLHYITNVIQKDIKFRNALKGIIIGLFTENDYEKYMEHSSNINKRMMNLVVERLCSQVQILENEE
jgi:hypothetical protein